MNTENKESLTGWLILLMILLVVSSISGVGKEITESRRSWEPYFADYPSLATAVLLYQSVLFGSVCAALATVLVLYKRVPGTLVTIKRAFIAAMLLRMAAGWVFDLFAGLPEELSQPMQSEVISTLIFMGYVAAWYTYLARSKRVREIYASNSDGLSEARINRKPVRSS